MANALFSHYDHHAPLARVIFKIYYEIRVLLYDNMLYGRFPRLDKLRLFSAIRRSTRTRNNLNTMYTCIYSNDPSPRRGPAPSSPMILLLYINYYNLRSRPAHLLRIIILNYCYYRHHYNIIFGHHDDAFVRLYTTGPLK